MIDPASIQVGDIYLINLDDISHNEQAGIRPAIIIAKHIETNLFMVIPMTSSDISRFPYSQIIKVTNNNGLKNDSYAMIFQMRAIAFKRIINRIGKIDPSDMSILKVRLKNYLKL